MNWQKITLMGWLGILLVTLSCAPTFVGTEGAVYKNMQVYALFDKDMDSVYNAAKAALADMQIEPTKSEKDSFAARIMASTADGQSITISITPHDGKTKMVVKVGTLGNQERSMAIYEKTKAKLK